MDQYKYNEGFLQKQECPHAGTPRIAAAIALFSMIELSQQRAQRQIPDHLASLHLHLHLSHLADALIQSYLQIGAFTL
jgi:hypothetical protein